MISHNNEEFIPLIQTNQFKYDLKKDIIGLEKAKQDLKRYINDESTQSILVYGGPGFGKTALIKAICHETKLNPLYFNVANFTFSGEQLAKYLFEQACLNQPCILVLDDLETLFLCQDQFSPVISLIVSSFKKISNDSMRVVLIGITNRPWILTDEFRNMFKAGVEIGLPNPIEREMILKLALDEVKLDDSDLKELASKTDGFSGSDLYGLSRDIGLASCRKFFNSTHFRKIQFDENSFKYKCSSENDPGAIQMNPLEIDSEQIILDPIDKDDVINISARHKATVKQDYIEKFNKFTNDFFSK